MYLLEFAGGFVIQVLEFHANSLNKFIRAYLSNYFNALNRTIGKIEENFHLRLIFNWINIVRTSFISFYKRGSNSFTNLRENKQRLCKFSKNLSNKNKQRLWNVPNSSTSQFSTALLIKDTKCKRKMVTFASKSVSTIIFMQQRLSARSE